MALAVIAVAIALLLLAASIFVGFWLLTYTMWKIWRDLEGDIFGFLMLERLMARVALLECDIEPPEWLVDDKEPDKDAKVFHLVKEEEGEKDGDL